MASLASFSSFVLNIWTQRLKNVVSTHMLCPKFSLGTFRETKRRDRTLPQSFKQPDMFMANKNYVCTLTVLAILDVYEIIFLGRLSKRSRWPFKAFPRETESHILVNSFETQRAENFPTFKKKKVLRWFGSLLGNQQILNMLWINFKRQILFEIETITLRQSIFGLNFFLPEHVFSDMIFDKKRE